MAPETTRTELYRFQYFDLMRRKWTKARYRAELKEIAARYGCFKLDGPPEIREVSADSLTAGHSARDG
jgi:hypothetical protein